MDCSFHKLMMRLANWRGSATLRKATMTVYSSSVAFPLLFLFWVIFLGFSASCALFGGGDSEPPRAKNYRLNPPSTWKSHDKSDSDQAYRLESGNVVTVTSSCARNTNAPLETLTRQLLIGSRNMAIEKRERFSIEGNEGLFTKLITSYENHRFYLEVVVLPAHGCVFDFSLVSPQSIPEKDSRDFKEFFKSFRYGKN